jgi:hypothetical protein
MSRKHFKVSGGLAYMGGEIASGRSLRDGDVNGYVPRVKHTWLKPNPQSVSGVAGTSPQTDCAATEPRCAQIDRALAKDARPVPHRPA